MLTEAEILCLPIVQRSYHVINGSPAFFFDGTALQCGRCDLYVRGNVGAISLDNYDDSDEDLMRITRWANGGTAQCEPHSSWYKIRFEDNDCSMPMQASIMSLRTVSSRHQIWPEIRFQQKYDLTILEDGVHRIGIVVRNIHGFFSLHEFDFCDGVFKLVYNTAIYSIRPDQLNADDVVFQTTYDRVWTTLCMDRYKLLIVLQNHWRRRKAVIAVDLMRAAPAELFHLEYGQLRQKILQERDQRCCRVCPLIMSCCQVPDIIA